MNDHDGQAAPNHDNVEDIQISYWMVAFLDMLGYKALLDQLETPLDQAASDDIGKALRHCVVSRRRLVATANTFMRSAIREHNDSLMQELAGSPPGDLKNWLRAEVIQLPGADHVVLACSTAPSEQHFPLRGVYSVIVGTAVSMLMQLAMGHEDPERALPLRGGIHLAPGAFVLPERMLYSAALSGASVLEKGAVNPRTLVSDRVVSYVQMYTGDPSRSARSNVEREMAGAVAELLYTDSDGKTAVDFFGPAMSRFVRDSNLSLDVGALAWRCAADGLQIMGETKSKYVADKWRALVDYMRPRLVHWDITE